MSARLYADWNATAPVLPAAREAGMAAMDLIGNASSVHGDGRKVRAVIERARKAVAGLVGVSPDDLVFTSGGTEALYLGAHSAVKACEAQAVFFSSVEHDAAEAAARAAAHAGGMQAIEMPVDGDGRLDIAGLRARLEALGAPAVLVLQSVNNETGVVQPVKAASDAVHAHGGLVVIDAVQSVGRVPFSLVECGGDYAALSGHKFGAFTGVGALARLCGHPWAPLFEGGGQERYGRAGTENLLGIAGLGAAADAASERFDVWGEAHTEKLRDELSARLIDAGALVFGVDVPRAGGCVAFADPDIPAETAVMAFDLAGIALSAGSACTSGKAKPSKVAAAMGRADLAPHLIRASFGPETPHDAPERIAAVWQDLKHRTAGRRAA